MEVTFTGSIPICLKCKAATTRTSLESTTTLFYYKPEYDEHGNNMNPDRNTITRRFRCGNCNLVYSIRGNQYDGWNYTIGPNFQYYFPEYFPDAKKPGERTYTPCLPPIREDASPTNTLYTIVGGAVIFLAVGFIYRRFFRN